MNPDGDEPPHVDAASIRIATRRPARRPSLAQDVSAPTKPTNVIRAILIAVALTLAGMAVLAALVVVLFLYAISQGKHTPG